MLFVGLFHISFTLSLSALQMAGLQAWSWTVEPHTPQPFQYMMAMSCSKVNNNNNFFIINGTGSIIADNDNKSLAYVCVSISVIPVSI